jgi:hypothetical protein
MESLVPEGTSFAEAKSKMEARGFRCSTYTDIPKKKDYLMCYIKGHGFLVKRQWLVRFEVRGGFVFDPYVGTDLLGP